MRAIKITGLFFIVALGLYIFLYLNDAIASPLALLGLGLALVIGFAVLAFPRIPGIVWAIVLVAFCALGWFLNA